ILFVVQWVASNRPGFPHLDTVKYRNISIITTLNIYRDTINELSVRRFADTSQELVKNFSVDKLSTRAVDKKNGHNVSRHTSDSQHMGPSLQKVLWSALPSTTNKHIPGCLNLCVGMPILIKLNESESQRARRPL
ncbi:hypothetical protein B0H17DRAFT_1238228, partial [Mycena rosella]